MKPPSKHSPSEKSETEVDGCRTPPPILLAVDHVPEAERAALSRCVREADCRLYEGLEARPGAFVIAGYPEGLATLRNLLLPLRALHFVREAVESKLGGVAAPEGLPKLREELYKKTEVAEEMPIPKGTTLLVSRDFSFDAAHNLPRYHGKCERLHGHTFKLQVTVKAPLDTWSGMAFDFNDLKKTVESRVISILDHAYVNEVVANPSAEYIAIWVWQRLTDLPLAEIKVWETPTCHVTYRGPE